MKTVLMTYRNRYQILRNPQNLFLMLVTLLAFNLSAGKVFAQTESPSVLYVPVIGLTSVPEPLALPKGTGSVTYKYAVKNFIKEVPLSNIQVEDDECSPVKFVEGDDNRDSKLDFDETWRYTCKTDLSITTQSTAKATGVANNMTATHKAYASVVVGSDNPPPLVSIINITKVANPLSLPAEGGKITYTYKVSNPGVEPLSDVTVSDNKCPEMSSKLGDTNGNNLLDIEEVWIYTCTSELTETTTNTATVVGFANGLKAVGEATISVRVDSTLVSGTNAKFPTAGGRDTSKMIIWGVLAAIIVGLFFLRKNKKFGKTKFLKFNNR